MPFTKHGGQQKVIGTFRKAIKFGQTRAEAQKSVQTQFSKKLYWLSLTNRLIKSSSIKKLSSFK